MSQLTHPRPQILDLGFRFRTWLAVVAAIVVAAVPTHVAISNGDGSAKNDSAAPASDLRYDGGPDEGTRGTSSQSSPGEGTQLSGARP